MESSFRLLRFRGIEIGANWSWLLIVGYFVVVLTQRVFPDSYPNLSGPTHLVMAIITTVLFFATLLLHELGHAVRALKEGMEIDGITLMLFGGVARFKGMFPSAGAEFRIAIAGPLVTLVIMVFFFALTWLLEAVDGPAQIIGVTDYLAWINALLLGFNLVPALPLDGGRVLRAYLWHRQGNFAAATESAAKGGRAFGAVLIGIGVLSAFSGAGLGGLLPALVGWFLMQAARAETTFAQLRLAIGDLRVGDLMTPDPDVVSPSTKIAVFIENVAHARGHSTYPVVYRRRLVGLVSLRLAARIPIDERLTKTVRDVMVPLEEVPTVAPDAEVLDALTALQGGPGRLVVVDEKGHVLGIVSGSDIARAIEMERIRGPREAPVAARRTPWIVWVIITGVIVVAGGYLYTPQYVVVAPGRSFDITEGIHISGRPVDDVNGKYLLTSVSVQRQNALGLAIAVLRSREIVPINALIPRGTDEGRYFEQQRTLFEETRMLAAAAAARAAGLTVNLNGTGARVLAILPGSPAEGVFEEGDVITAIEGQPVSRSDEVVRVIRSRPSGANFAVSVERGGQKRDVAVRSRAGLVEGRPGIGVSVDTRDFRIDLPFTVRFDELEIGGPSAGVTYALAVYDLLIDDDIARGRAIAATGEIDLEGRVIPVGGVEEKAVAADDAGAQLFLVPEDEVEAARGAGLDVQGIANLMEAIEFLKSGKA